MKKQPLYLWLRKQPLRIRDKAVLSKLCQYANDDTYEAGVRVSDLAIDVSCCERTIQTTLRHLEGIKLIEPTGRTKRLRSGDSVAVHRVAPELDAGGAEAAPLPRPSVHPEGRNCPHPNKRAGINLSKERGESAAPRSSVPSSIREAFVAYLGESFATAFLDRCEWDGLKRTLSPHSSRAYERVRFEGWRELRDLKITVLKRNG